MLHVSYGLFDDAHAAQSAVDAIGANGALRGRVTVTLHRDRLDEGQVGVEETGAREGRRIGAALGGVTGAIAGGAAMGPIGLASGGMLGALYGVVAGALAGTGAPEPTLERISKELAAGKALVVAEASSLDARSATDAEMRAHGGNVVHKPLA